MDKRLSSLLALLLGMNICAASEDKGSCPKAVPTESTLPSVPQPFATEFPGPGYAASVYLQVMISDKGHVCYVQWIEGLGGGADHEEIDEAIKDVLQRHFVPAQKNGRPVPTTVKIRVGFFRDANGKLFRIAPNQTVK